MIQRVKANWALSYCVLSAAVMLALTTFGGRLHRHFIIFLDATRDLFDHVSPYGKAYDSLGVGSYFHYAPSAAFVFRPFVSFSYPVANGLYMGLSLVILFTGLLRFIRIVTPAENVKRGTLSLFFLIVSSEIIGSTFGAKLEVITMGALFWAFLFLMTDRILLGATILGVATVWKLQPVPIVGLLGLAVLSTKNVPALGRLAAGLLLALLISILGPFLFISSDFLIPAYRSWLGVLGDVAGTTWQTYQSIFVLSNQLFGWPKTYGALEIFMVLGGIGFAGLLLWTAQGRAPKERMWIAFALGSAFLPLFSPMSQGMAYILGTPMLLFCALRRMNTGSALSRKAWTAALLFHWYVTSLNFSDLVPEMIRISSLTIRPLGFMALTALAVWDLRKSRV